MIRNPLAGLRRWHHACYNEGIGCAERTVVIEKLPGWRLT